jgi:hypothetical protein
MTTKRTSNGPAEDMRPEPIPPSPALEGDAPRGDDPFEDLSAIRLGQDFDAELGVKRLLTRVMVRRPDRQEWIRVRSGPEWRLDVSALEFREDRDWYLVMPAARGVLLSDLAGVRLHTAINRQNQLFLWPIKLPTEGRRNPWLETAMDAAGEAERCWIRVVAGRGCYDVFSASCPDLADPEWPEESFNALLRLAFKDRLVDRPDHPVVQRLAGAV